MKIEHEFAIEDVCIHSVLTYEQAMQLWRILGDEDKIKKAAEDANKRGFQTVYDFAVAGVYNSWVSTQEISIEDQIAIELNQLGVSNRGKVLAYIKGLKGTV